MTIIEKLRIKLKNGTVHPAYIAYCNRLVRNCRLNSHDFHPSGYDGELIYKCKRCGILASVNVTY